MLKKMLQSFVCNKRDIGFLAGLTILIIGSLFSFVNAFADLCLPDAQVTIKATGVNENGLSEIWIAQRSDPDTILGKAWNLADDFEIDSQDVLWEYNEDDYEYNVLRLSGNNLNVPVNLMLPYAPNTQLNFWANEASANTEITINGKPMQIDLFSIQEDGEIISIYPFAESKVALLIRFFIYFVLGVIVFAALLMLYNRFKKGIRMPRWLLKSYSFQNVWVLFAGFYALSYIYYKVGIPNFMQMGDQLYYWNIAELMLSDFQTTILNAASFRGVLSSLFPMIALQLGQFLSADPILIYFIFTNFAAAFLVGYVLPSLQEELCGYKAKLYQTAILTFVLLVFWLGVLTVVLADFIGFVFLMTYLLFLTKFQHQNKAVYSIVFGTSAAFAISFRSSHMYVVIPVFLFAVIERIVLQRKSEQSNEKKQVKNKYWTNLIVSMFAFIFICIPQIYSNYQNNHIGLFPYDHKDAWEENLSVTKLNMNHAHQNIITGYPFVRGDQQSVNIKTDIYPIAVEEQLEINQLLDAYSAQPIDTLVMIGKKLFLGLDTKTSVSYPSRGLGKHSFYYVFSFLNYFVIASAFFMLIKMKWSNREKTFLWIIMLLIAIPQTIIHVEWRYYLGAYFLLYYVFAFKFSRVIEDKKEFAIILSNGYLPFITGFIYLSMLLSLTFIA